MFGVAIQWASYEKPAYHADAFTNANRELDEAKKLGVNVIRVDLEYDTWSKFQVEYGEFFNRVKSMGFKLFLWPLPSPGSSVNLTDYDDFLAYMAYTYQPDFLDTYGEAPNPQGTLTWRIKETATMTVDDWVTAAFNLVQKIRPYAINTKIGAHFNAGKSPGNAGFDLETQFFSKIANINGPFDWVGIEPYSVLEVDQQEIAINQYWDGQLPLWIAETDYLAVNLPDNDAERQLILTRAHELYQKLGMWGYIVFALYDNPYFFDQTDRQHQGILNRDWSKKNSYYTCVALLQVNMPTFGNVVIGPSKATGMPDGYKQGIRATCLEDGTLQSFSIYFGAVAPTGVKAALYADNAGASGALLATSLPVAGIPNSWNAVPITYYPLIKNAVYHLVWKCDIAYDLVYKWGPIGCHEQKYEPYNLPFSDPFGIPNTIGEEYFSVYATYTTAAPVIYALTINSAPNGTTSPIPGPYSYNQGAIATIQAIPNTGYQFDHWNLNGTPYTQNPITITMNANHTLQAQFIVSPQPNYCVITVDTTPLKGTVYVDNIAVGTAPISVQVNPGTHGIGFGEIIGYDIPRSRAITIAAGQTIAITGNYVHVTRTILGINSDHAITISNIATARSLGLKFLEFEIDSRMGYVDSALPKYEAIATECDKYPDMTVAMIVNPLYGFFTYETGDARSDQWWIDVVEKVMDRMKTHPSVRFIGLYGQEHYRVEIGGWDITHVTVAELTEAYTKFNLMAEQRGLTPNHYGGGGSAWGNLVDKVAFKAISRNGHWAGTYPDPYAGWIWTQNPPSAWQYQWVEDYEVKIHFPDTPFMLATGMWSSQTTFGYPAGDPLGYGWTYRNSKWYLDAIIAAGHTPGGEVLTYATFMAWADGLITGNPGFVQAVMEYQGMVTVGMVIVATNPLGGRVYIDQIDYGLAPATIPNVPAGNHIVSFGTLSGYSTPIDQPITVVAGQTTNVTGTYIVIPPTTGTLDISTNPSGGEILIDNVSYGFAPKVIGSVPPGIHTVGFGDIPGYAKPNPQPVNVVAGQMLTVIGNYVLIPTHSLTINSTPSGIQFSINGASATTQYSQVLPEADYVIDMPPSTMIGPDIYNFASWEDGSINPSRTASLTAAMNLVATFTKVIVPPTTHTLTIDSVPTGAPFTIDGNAATTPYSQTLDEGIHTIVMPPGVTSGTTAYVFSNWEDATTNPTKIVNLIGNMSLIATYVAAPPATGTLMMDTIGTPTKGEVFVNDISWGPAPQSKAVNIGTYTVSFGPIAGFQTPQSQIVDVSENQITSVIATYVAISPPVTLASAAVVGSAVSVVTVIIYKVLTG